MEAQTAMTMSPKAMSKLRNLTAHYIRARLVMANDSEAQSES